MIKLIKLIKLLIDIKSLSDLINKTMLHFLNKFNSYVISFFLNSVGKQKLVIISFFKVCH